MNHVGIKNVHVFLLCMIHHPILCSKKKAHTLPIAHDITKHSRSSAHFENPSVTFYMMSILETISCDRCSLHGL